MDNLAGQKHGCSSATSDSSSNDTAKKAKHQVTVRTYEKWQCELDPEYRLASVRKEQDSHPFHRQHALSML